MIPIDFSSILEEADALLVVPPFSSHIMPSIGVHTLQACAAHQGIKVQVLNLNVAMAAEVGEETFLTCCTDLVPWWSIFAKTAYDTAFSMKAFIAEVQARINTIYQRRILWKTTSDYQEVVRRITAFYNKIDIWLEAIALEIIKRNYKVVGCSSTFGQTEASIALLRKIKESDFRIITILGGANCFGEMSEGILSLSNSVDYVFSGESEKVFVDFMLQVKDGNLPGDQVIRPIVQDNIDLIPLPVYDDYFRQLDFFLDSRSMLKTSHLVTLPYETSRGCWWGEKRQCTFCGMNGETRRHREKSSKKTLKELRVLLEKYPTRKIGMVDNDMPQSYFRTFFPQVDKELPQIEICYEIRATVSLEELLLLKRAGVAQLQPGVESLSTSLLRRMDKGCLARQNIGFLRNTTALNLQVNWNILWGFPGDTEEEYTETLERVTMMKHLWPPNFMQMGIARFSKYFNDPGKYGISRLKPIIEESFYLPKSTKVEKLAGNFTGSFPSFSLGAVLKKDNVIDAIEAHIISWKDVWKARKKPIVHLEEISQEKYCIVDTRQLNGGSKNYFIDKATASEIVVSRPMKSGTSSPAIDWACENKLGLLVDHWYVSLITSKGELLLSFEELLEKTSMSC